MIGLEESQVKTLFNGIEEYKHFESIKLVLFPLSNIKEAIQVNNETIVPMNELARKLFDREPLNSNSVDSCMSWIENKFIQELSKPKGYDNIPHWIYQDLIKWHFDLFGLIEKGLAVDINNL